MLSGFCFHGLRFCRKEMTMKSLCRLVAIVSFTGIAITAPALADDDKPSAGHDAFLKGLQELTKPALVSSVEVKSASKPRSLSPVVSRFKGWFIDVTDKAKDSKLDGNEVAEGISLASKAAASSHWQFVR